MSRIAGNELMFLSINHISVSLKEYSLIYMVFLIIFFQNIHQKNVELVRQGSLGSQKILSTGTLFLNISDAYFGKKNNKNSRYHGSLNTLTIEQKILLIDRVIKVILASGKIFWGPKRTGQG